MGNIRVDATHAGRLCISTTFRVRKKSKSSSDLAVRKERVLACISRSEGPHNKRYTDPKKDATSAVPKTVFFPHDIPMEVKILNIKILTIMMTLLPLLLSLPSGNWEMSKSVSFE